MSWHIVSSVAVGAVFLGSFAYQNIDEYLFTIRNLNSCFSRGNSPYKTLEIVKNAREKTGRNFLYYFGKLGRERAYKRFRKAYDLH